jgi:glutaredoxin
MILLIGKKNCSRCSAIKTIFQNKNIDYQYKEIEEYSEIEQEKYKDMAKLAKQSSFPIIIKDNKVITLQEV